MSRRFVSVDICSMMVFSCIERLLAAGCRVFELSLKVSETRSAILASSSTFSELDIATID